MMNTISSTKQLNFKDNGKRKEENDKVCDGGDLVLRIFKSGKCSIESVEATGLFSAICMISDRCNIILQNDQFATSLVYGLNF